MMEPEKSDPAARRRAGEEDEHDWKPVFQSNFRSALLDWRAWIRKAELFRSISDGLIPQVREYWRLAKEWVADQKAGGARRLHAPSSEVCGAYLMLASYAVENLLKAGLVLKRRWELQDEFDTTGLLPGKLKSHRLYELATWSGLSPTVEDEGLLRRLGHAAIWYGRYPVPTDPMVYDGQEFSDGKKYNLRSLAESDADRVPELADRIRRELGV